MRDQRMPAPKLGDANSILIVLERKNIYCIQDLRDLGHSVGGDYDPITSEGLSAWIKDHPKQAFSLVKRRKYSREA